MKMVTQNASDKEAQHSQLLYAIDMYMVDEYK